MLGYKKDLPDYDYDPQKAKALLKQAGLEQGAEVTLWSMPVQRPYNPNSKRIAEMIQNDWAKVGVKAKIVSYEWGEYLAGMRKGEHDSALYGWMSDNGDPDNFAGTLLSCDNIQTGSNAARWCDKSYDALVKKALLVSDPQARAKLYEQAQEIFYQQAPWITPGDRENLLCDAQQRQRLHRQHDGERFFQSEAELSERRTGWHIWMRLSSKSMTPAEGVIAHMNELLIALSDDAQLSREERYIQQQRLRTAIAHHGRQHQEEQDARREQLTKGGAIL